MAVSTVYQEPLKHAETKANFVYQRLCAIILEGHLGPGDRLNIDEIARDLGVSKIPIREAIQRLETQGLVVQTPYSGARIAPASHRELIGIFLMRIELEALAARLAALTITDEDLATLRAIDARMQVLCDADAGDALLPLNNEFHKVIARATGYTTLLETIEMTFLQIARYRRVMATPKERWLQVLEEHTALIAALADHDPIRAARTARAHVRQQVPNEIRAHASEFFPPDQEVTDS